MAFGAVLICYTQSLFSEKVFSDGLYDACDTPITTSGTPATVPLILNMEKKIEHAIHLMFSKIKGIKVSVSGFCSI